MPLDETIDTFSYFVKEADKLDLAYICFLRYLELFDVVIDGRFLSSVNQVYYLTRTISL